MTSENEFEKFRVEAVADKSVGELTSAVLEEGNAIADVVVVVVVNANIFDVGVVEVVVFFCVVEVVVSFGVVEVVVSFGVVEVVVSFGVVEVVVSCVVVEVVVTLIVLGAVVVSFLSVLVVVDGLIVVKIVFIGCDEAAALGFTLLVSVNGGGGVDLSVKQSRAITLSKNISRTKQSGRKPYYVDVFHYLAIAILELYYFETCGFLWLRHKVD